MPKTAKDTFFKTDKAGKRDKGAADAPPFRAIANEESVARLRKTARLKEQRLLKEAEDAKLAPVAAPKKASKAAREL
ncbi:hypothetical protein [Rhizobium sp. HT1-10]|uniref:hypothetical protein n=1 Tax=Rhizobium sp. HT1-10 TaxID=3111638 RepID=UPI003C13694A